MIEYLNRLYPRIGVINLEYRPERLRDFQRFNSGLRFERIPGVIASDGRDGCRLAHIAAVEAGFDLILEDDCRIRSWAPPESIPDCDLIRWGRGLKRSNGRCLPVDDYWYKVDASAVTLWSAYAVYNRDLILEWFHKAPPRRHFDHWLQFHEFPAVQFTPIRAPIFQANYPSDTTLERIPRRG